MASSRAVVAALKLLGRAFAGTVDVERVELYRAALIDLTDEQLAAACLVVIRTHTGDFIPPPAKIRAAVGADTITPVDVDATIRQIEALSMYNAASAMIRPSVAVVRVQLGEAVAQAYAAAGADRIFREGDDTGRDIARRDFATALQEWTRRSSAGLLPSGVEPRVKELDRRAQRLIAGIVARITLSEDAHDPAE